MNALYDKQYTKIEKYTFKPNCNANYDGYTRIPKTADFRGVKITFTYTDGKLNDIYWENFPMDKLPTTQGMLALVAAVYEKFKEIERDRRCPEEANKHLKELE